MLLNSLALCCLVTTLCSSVLPQAPGATPSAPARTAQAPKGDPLLGAFVDADGHRRIPIAAAADQVLACDAAGRTKFMTTLRAIAAVAPKPTAPEAATPKATPPESGTPPPNPADAKPLEFADEIKQLMASVVTGTPEASKTALVNLAENKEAGPAALRRLDERGKAIFERCLSALIRKKVQTGAVYAGQYDEVMGFQPEAGAILLRWAQDAPKDVSNIEQFCGACLRALRDVVPKEQATDAMRDSLRKIAAKAQKANSELFLTAVCALHQYGDPSMFDKIKAEVAGRAASEDAQDKTSALSTLADLHYQLRQYEDAANYYKSLVELAEQSDKQAQNLSTTIYNAACSLSLAKKTDEAFQYLEKALQTAAKGRALAKAMIDEDHDMNNLREDPRFPKLMEQYYGKAPAPRGK